MVVETSKQGPTKSGDGTRDWDFGVVVSCNSSKKRTIVDRPPRFRHRLDCSRLASPKRIMPKRRRRKDDDAEESSESDYEDGQDDDDDDDEPATDLDEDEEVEQEVDSDYDDIRPMKVASASKSSKKKVASAPRSSSRKRSAHRSTTDDRKTAAGGYSHTVESKLRISQANRGNTPWNKGRNRSELDKAKITAGVRARNHLLAKRQREAYGLTEAEADQLKRRIKYLREKVRRLRVDNNKRQEAKREGREAWAKVEHEAVGRSRRRRREEVAATVGRRNQPGRRVAAAATAAGGESDSSASISKSSSSDEDDSSGSDGDENEESSAKATESSRDATTKSAGQLAAQAFRPELSWTPHPMDTLEIGQMCPQGGPGGFECCADCTAQCTQYMVATFAELEKHKISNVGIQVQQLQEVSAASSRRLEQTVRACRRKPTHLLLAYRRPQPPPTATAARAGAGAAHGSSSNAATERDFSFGTTAHEV